MIAHESAGRFEVDPISAVTHTKEFKAKTLLHCMSLATNLLTEMPSLYAIFRAILSLTSTLLQKGDSEMILRTW